MAYSDITLTVCSDGLDPRATSLFPDGDRPSLSGGSAALEWITNGTLAHGDLITVRTNVAGLFGEPDLRSQSLSMVGNETLINGVNNPWLADYADNEILRGYASTGGIAAGQIDLPPDPDSPYLGIIAAVKSSQTRHSNIASSFKMSAFGNLSASGTEPGLFSWPRPFSESDRVPDSGSLCVATWMFYDFDNAEEVCRVRYSSITGTFQTGSNSILTRAGAMVSGGIVGAGERVSLTSGLGKVAAGNVMLVDTVNKWLYVFIDRDYEEWHTIFDWTGATIVGATSAATTTIPTYSAWDNSTNYPSGYVLYSNTTGIFYTSQQNGNIGNDPAMQGGSTAWWAVNTDIIRNEGSNKSARILRKSGSNANSANLIVGTNGSINLDVFYDDGGSSYNEAVKSTPLKPLPFAWHRRTVWVDYRPDGNGKIMCGQIIDGVVQTLLINVHNVSSALGPVLSNWGIEATVHNGHTTICSELKTYTDNMMCIVSSSPTWAGADYAEYEPLVMVGHRTPTEAQFKLHRGVHSSIVGKYLYVLRDPITPINTSGLLLEGA